MVEEKRGLRLERWEIESRIERTLADAVPAVSKSMLELLLSS